MTARFHTPEIHRKTLVGMFVLLVVCAGTASITLANGPPPEVGFDQNLGDKIPLDLKLRNENGEDVALGAYFGEKPVILMPVYYKCPMLCGLELNGLVRCLRALNLTIGMTAEKDFEILTFSIDPGENTDLASKKRKQYLAQYGVPQANDGWHFFTGDEQSIKTLCDTIGFRTKYNEVNGQYAHAAGIVVCTPDGMISRYLYGVEFAPKDVRLAVVESAKGEVGGLAEHVLLFCFSYDPETGKYGWRIKRLLQVSGVLTVLVLAGSVGWMIRHDRTSLNSTAPLEGAHHD